jgi:histidine triad (HIT) family protein
MLDLLPEEISSIYLHAQELAAALCKAFDPVGFNIFQNNGIASGQTVPHFHVHLIPRYSTDDPEKIFKARQVGPTPLEERLLIAEEIKRHL